MCVDIEKKIKAKEHKIKCDRLDICHICGEDLKSREGKYSTDNLLETEHYCQIHGIMWTDY